MKAEWILDAAVLCSTGRVRTNNEDNFYFNGSYLKQENVGLAKAVHKKISGKNDSVFCVFDGMGGEECGEIASYIASKTASTIEIGKEATADLSQFCHKANAEICDYATLHEVSAMGTTAAMLVFAEKEVVLCNIGDSKIFRLCDGTLEQISKDHVAVSAFGVKPPLSQNLGIPPNELVIDPYLARGAYNDGDVYLICSDGLTDMVSVAEITEVLISKPIEEAITLLLDKALANGGKDNTTIILIKIERQSGWFFKRKRHTKRKEV